MKNVLLFLVFVFSIGLSSCEKEEDDVYYIRYKIECSNKNSGTLLVSFKTANEEEISLELDQNTKWEMVIGPVARDFQAELSIANSESVPGINLYAEIDEKKNDEPFVMKLYGASNADSMSYFANGTYYHIVGTQKSYIGG